MPAATRTERVEQGRRNPRWAEPPLRIEMSECLVCDTCLRHCPPRLGAIQKQGFKLVIIPELCSGCRRCVPHCPAGCIRPDPDWSPDPVSPNL